MKEEVMTKECMPDICYKPIEHHAYRAKKCDENRYGYTAETESGLDMLESSKSGNFGDGLGICIPVLGLFSINAGQNDTEGFTSTQTMLSDVNGDGLPDLLRLDGSDLKVTLNTGDGFMPEDELYKNHNISDNLGSSVAYYGSTAYTFTIHLPFGFRINITPSIQASHSESVNRTVASLMNIDGDGLLDLVYSNSDSRLVAHRNLAGRTNLLRTVTLPFGGHIHIGYQQTEPSFDMPGRRWVMSSVETTGGYKENGATSSRNEFTYEGGYRDQRMEHTYDALGRQATARAPYEIESGQPFTIKFEYFPKERKAHTIHYTQDGNIDTYTFADSLMRAVQTKQTGVVWNGGSTSKVSIVSGRAVLDAFGRNIASYYPTTESYGTMEGVYINGAPQGITLHETDNFTLYLASILTVNKNRFTKHYFIGSRRVASLIGPGTFNNGKRASAIGRGVVTAITIGKEFIPVVGPLISFGLGATDTLVGDKFYKYMDKKFD